MSMSGIGHPGSPCQLARPPARQEHRGSRITSLPVPLGARYAGYTHECSSKFLATCGVAVMLNDPFVDEPQF
jgi:hypothetical protein